MATISSHVLDSVVGTHAAGIRVECYRLESTGTTTLVFDKKANEQGRISESVEIPQGRHAAEFELVFHSKAYFEGQTLLEDKYQIMNSVVVRLSLPDPNDNYHIPIMLAPHSYSVWWSGMKPDTHQSN